MNPESGADDAPNLFDDAEAPAPVVPPLDMARANVGEILQHQRAVLGVSLDDCYRKLRIRKVYLEALEAENLSELPSSRTTVRSYIRAYAGFLELDADDLVAQFSEQYYPQVASTVHRQPKPLPSLPTNAILFMVACILLLLIGIGLVQNYLNTEEATTTQPVIAPPPRVKMQEITPQPTAETAPEAVSTESVPVQSAQGPAPLSGVRIVHDQPIWMTIENPDGTGRRIQLQPQVPLEIAFGAGQKILIDDFHEVMITLIEDGHVAAGDVPYSILADSAGWVSIDKLKQD